MKTPERMAMLRAVDSIIRYVVAMRPFISILKVSLTSWLAVFSWVFSSRF